MMNLLFKILTIILFLIGLFILAELSRNIEIIKNNTYIELFLLFSFLISYAYYFIPFLRKIIKEG